MGHKSQSENGGSSTPDDEHCPSLQRFAEISDGFYVNVNNADAFLISMAYSKASIGFICFIGSLTALNTLTFSSQVQVV